MTNKFLITIKGDSNDGDMVENSFIHDENTAYREVGIPADKFFPDTPMITNIQLVYGIINALKIPRPDQKPHDTHNWARPEYDAHRMDAAYTTIRNLCIVLYGIDIYSEEASEKYGEDLLEDVFDKIYEFMNDGILPTGYDGIHTIDSITIRPYEPERHLLKSLNYKDALEYKKQLAKVDTFVVFGGGVVGLYDTRGPNFMTYDGHSWDVTNFKSKDQLISSFGKENVYSV